MQERLQKFLSQAGVASRRAAEKLILAGKVKVNGRVANVLGTKIDPAKDKITVAGKLVGAGAFIYLVLNKPKGYMTTRYDPRRRKTVFDLLPVDLKTKIWPVGRLDYQTEGLLLFTNDGELTQVLTHPSGEHEKEYEVELDKEISEGKLEKIKSGMVLDGRKTSPARAKVFGNKIFLTIHEGRKRQIRRMFSSLGYTVRSLKRVRIGKLKLNGLQLGQHKFINRAEIL